MTAVSVCTAKGIARRFRAGLAFGSAPRDVDADAATLAVLRADPSLVVTESGQPEREMQAPPQDATPPPVSGEDE